MKQFFLRGEIDGVPVRWLVLRSTDGAVTWLDEHLVQEVVSSTWATTTFSDLEVKEPLIPYQTLGWSHQHQQPFMKFHIEITRDTAWRKHQSDLPHFC